MPRWIRLPLAPPPGSGEGARTAWRLSSRSRRRRQNCRRRIDDRRRLAASTAAADGGRRQDPERECKAATSVTDIERRRPGAGLVVAPPDRGGVGASNSALETARRCRTGGHSCPQWDRVDYPALIGALRLALPAIVVDDASDDDTAVIGRTLGCVVVTLDRRLGPAGARNAGWRGAEEHRSSPSSIPTAGRGRARWSGWPPISPIPARRRCPAHSPNAGGGTTGAIGRYEARRGSEDMGALPAQVRPLSRVAYAPTVLLMTRRAALAEIDGFDESMFLARTSISSGARRGRLGGSLRSGGASLPRPPAVGCSVFIRKFAYGSAAAALERRHPGGMRAGARLGARRRGLGARGGATRTGTGRTRDDRDRLSPGPRPPAAAQRSRRPRTCPGGRGKLGRFDRPDGDGSRQPWRSARCRRASP